jgi:TRAP-type C4-dicarboxylate transport system substrate-binding protein
MRLGLLLSLALLATPARAEPLTVRIATVAPEGSAWAREIAAWGRDVQAGAAGVVRLKIYYSGIGGDEFTVIQRIRRDQLDGAIGSEACTRLGPSMRVARIVGLFQSREESAYAMTRLKPVLDQEFLRAGFVNLAEATLGPEVLFTREPVHSMAELRRMRLWVWDLDETLQLQTAALGLKTVPRPVSQAARAYDDHALDGFITVPTGALAFQWTTQARYLEDLRISYRQGCVFLASRVFDPLPLDLQHRIRSATAKLRARMEDLGRRQDQALLGGLLARQGLKTVPVGERFRAEFFDLARSARLRLGGRIVPKKLLQTVLSWLADFRAEHEQAR